MKADFNRVQPLRRSHGDNLSDNTTLWMQGQSDSPHFDQQRLADILDEYLELIEEGSSVEVDDLIARYPEYAEPLREYLTGLHLLNAGFAELSMARQTKRQWYPTRILVT